MEDKDLKNLPNEEKREEGNNENSQKPEKITIKDTIISIATLIIFFAIVII